MRQRRIGATPFGVLLDSEADYWLGRFSGPTYIGIEAPSLPTCPEVMGQSHGEDAPERDPDPWDDDPDRPTPPSEPSTSVELDLIYENPLEAAVWLAKRALDRARAEKAELLLAQAQRGDL